MHECRYSSCLWLEDPLRYHFCAVSLLQRQRSGADTAGRICPAMFDKDRRCAPAPDLLPMSGNPCGTQTREPRTVTLEVCGLTASALSSDALQNMPVTKMLVEWRCALPCHT